MPKLYPYFSPLVSNVLSSFIRNGTSSHLALFVNRAATANVGIRLSLGIVLSSVWAGYVTPPFCMARVSPYNHILKLRRLHWAKNFNILISEIFCIQIVRGFHCKEDVYLKQMILHYASYYPIIVKVPPTSFDAKIFKEYKLHNPYIALTTNAQKWGWRIGK